MGGFQKRTYVLNSCHECFVLVQHCEHDHNYRGIFLKEGVCRPQVMKVSFWAMLCGLHILTQNHA